MTAAERSTLKPYKGTASYQVEDSELFFGRKTDAEQLLARVLSARMTLLHAQSGAGKTSLVNATIIPELERRGWTPVRVLLHNDPVASTRSTTLLSVIPPPDTEVAAIDRAVNAIPEAADGMTIGELLHLYDEMPVSDPRKRGLIAPVVAAEVSLRRSTASAGQSVVPYFCRLLRSTMDIEAFGSHVAAVQQGGDARLRGAQPIDASTPVVELRELLGSTDFRARFETLLAYLDPPSTRLWPFLKNLMEIYGTRRSRFALILIFDQFEEIFTRFVDPGKAAAVPAGDLPDWRLRYRFFDDLREVYRGRLPLPPVLEGEAPQLDSELPSIRFLISMRSEYIAQLGAIREFAPELDQSVFHLKLLSREGALDAIREPARLYGYRYTEECYTSIISDLTKEDRFVEPSHLSLICEKLWDETGSDMAVSSGTDDGPFEITLDVYEKRLQGAKGILRAFLRDYLNSLPESIDRTESLEILEPLITGTGTRNIVERRQLVDVPFRNADRRRTLLQGLVNRTIVRIEVRLGGDFVEITHEFLIPSIQEAMQEIFFANVQYQRVRSALQALRGLRNGYVGTDVDSLLTRDAFNALHDHLEFIEWTPFTTELMLRASIFYGRERETIAFWSRKLSLLDDPADVLTILDRVDRRDGVRDVLSAEELRTLNAQRDGVRLSLAQTAFVLRSQIVHSAGSQEDDIRFWAERAKA